MESRQVHISTGIVFRTILMILGLWFLYVIRDVIVLLFISVILVAAMEPLVDRLQGKKIPRAASVLGIYLILLLILAGAISFLIPPLISQVQSISHDFPQYSQKLDSLLNPINNFLGLSQINLGAEQLFSKLSDWISGFAQNIYSETIGVFSGLVSTIVVLSLAFYMSVEESGIKNFIITVVPKKYEEYTARMTERIMNKLGRWFLGQVFVMFIIFALDAAGLYLVGVPYALFLGIFAGLLEIIPYVGPIISAIPGIILGFTISPTVGLLATAVYFLAQQFEGNIVVPLVMKKAVGLNPITVILALLVGAKLAGVLGVILSVPIAAAVSLFVTDILDKSEKQPA